jgi:glycosyltransferase involved in cell wall biosynthesis
MQRAKAFVFAAEEDFGIVPVEAQAAGTPVIAYRKGGSLETVVENKPEFLILNLWRQ